MTLPRRTLFLARALSFIGTPYLWNGKTPTGVDCSGLVTLALWEAGGPDWRATHDSERLYAVLPPVKSPLPGDLAFYGRPDDIDHVMVWLPLGLVFGACGGGRTTTSVAEANRVQARVKVRESLHYRPDFQAFRSMPLSA